MYSGGGAVYHGWLSCMVLHDASHSELDGRMMLHDAFHSQLDRTTLVWSGLIWSNLV